VLLSKVTPHEAPGVASNPLTVGLSRMLEMRTARSTFAMSDNRLAARRSERWSPPSCASRISTACAKSAAGTRIEPSAILGSSIRIFPEPASASIPRRNHPGTRGSPTDSGCTT
jgi:hypothetical protein